MATYYGAADVQSFGMTHESGKKCAYDMSKPGKRFKPSVTFNNPLRSVPVLNTTCDECIVFLESPQGRMDWVTNPERAPKTADEWLVVDGTVLATQTALNNAMDALKAIQAAEANKQ